MTISMASVSGGRLLFHAQATALFLCLLLSVPNTRAEPAFYESEPNDSPDKFHRITGEITLYGTMAGPDQDGYLWTVTDNGARKRWNFKLYGEPGALTITEIVRLKYAENGVDIESKSSLMKMGTRDGLTPSVHRDLLFEPGEYVIGLAQMGSGKSQNSSAAFRPPVSGLSFIDKISPEETAEQASTEEPQEPGAYRFLITKGRDLHPVRNPGAREVREKAHTIRLRKTFSTFETRETSWYSLHFTEHDTASRWDLLVQAPLGRKLRARLVDSDGKVLLEKSLDSKGKLRFPDLAPTATTWYLELTTENPGFIQVITTKAVGERVAGEEVEPNGDRNFANRVDFSQPVTGRIGGDDKYDYFIFTADEVMSDQLMKLRIESDPAVKLMLCLKDSKWANVQCRKGITPIELPDLLLAPGEWGISIERAVETVYSLSLTAQGPLVPGIEVEPNDLIGNASGIPDNLRVKGRFSGDDTDYYQLMVSGEPLLWRFQVIGEGVQQLGYYDGSKKQQMYLKVKAGQRRARLENVFLLPGRHFVRVSGRAGGEYTLIARPLFPPDPNGEMEPNDKHNKQRLAIGQTRTGLFHDQNDKDYYRFFVANWDHLKLTIQPPVDGTIGGYLYWYDGNLSAPQSNKPGDPIILQGVFPPGDYHFWLTPKQLSVAEYTVSLERLPRFSCPSDCEPNAMGDSYLAAPLPNDLILEGNTGQWGDWDYYQLPRFDEPTELLIHTEEPLRIVALGTHFSARERLIHDTDLGGYHTVVPAGEPYRLMLDTRGQPYHLELVFPGGEIQPITEPFPGQLQLTLDTTEVSAFRTHGQRISGSLSLSHNSADTLQVGFDAVTSDYRWKVTLENNDITVPPNGSTSVPIEVLVPADAWADRTVRISIRVRDASGRQAETFEEITVGRETLSVNPSLHWAIPDSLRGGFNVAWLPFGGEWGSDTPKNAATDTLRDGLVFPHTRIDCCSKAGGWPEGEEPTWTIDLPGDEPMPIAGVAINHFGTPGPFRDLRKATLLLSQDGKDFEAVMSFEALPVETEQYFALERPLPARFARLRIEETFAEPSNQRLLAAEWKVIAEPGFDLSAGTGFNIAEPALGGHLVWYWPSEGYAPNNVLTQGDASKRAHTKSSDTKDYIVGFLHNRAAQITGVEWHYEDGLADKLKLFEKVIVSASTASPIGPWSPIGEMDLSGAKSSAMVNLPDPAWARFVRFTAHLRPEGGIAQAPGILRIWERPVDELYRSVLSEWGSIGPRGFYEQLEGVHAEVALEVSDNHSRSTAAPLELANQVRGQVSLSKLEHWYQMTVPEGQNTLLIELNGDPTVRTVLTLENSAGEAIPLRRIGKKDTPSRHQFEAIVEPAGDVYFHIAEPPRNVIFSWDTSASVNPYIPLINNALVAFSSQVVPGQEAVNLMPFGMGLLLDEWYGEPYKLQSILNDYRRVGASSSAEYTLKGAARELAPLAGTKAIVVITDAQTPHDGVMWDEMLKAQPRIFSIGIAGAYLSDQNRLRDWASINGGHFTQLLYDGEMEVAFDRATTLMHRPAEYTLMVQSEFREAPGPGLLSVVADDKSRLGGAAVELILDASGSMLQRIEGRRRIEVAKEVLIKALREQIPAGTPVALRVFGHKEVDSCRTDLEISLGPLDPKAAAEKIAGIQAMNLARTPIADSLKAIESDLKGASTGAAIILVTDGEETCGGDPAKVIKDLQAKGFDVNLNIVGFAIDDATLAGQFESWADLGGGRYFAADDQEGLSTAIEEALRIPFTVYDQGGNNVAQGQVGGKPVQLEQGFYRVVVNTSPSQTFDKIDVQGERDVVLKLE